MSAVANNKLDLVQMIVESEDKSFILKLLEYARSLKKDSTGDWSDELPDYVFDELKSAIDEADNGTDPGVSHDIILEKHRKKYPHLKL